MDNARVVQEPARGIPVFSECDVLVAGGGVSGVAAAVSAARAGARTILLERNGILGGVATSSLMGSSFNMFVLGNGEIMMRGFPGELADRLVAVGAASPYARHPEVPGFTFDCERLKVILIEMCQDAGVHVLSHAVAARPVMEGDKMAGCFFEGKSGRQAILACNTVDATGEADLIAQTGAPTEMFNGSASILFEMAPVNVDAFVDFVASERDRFPKGMDWVRDAEQLAANWRERDVLFFPHGGGMKWEYVQQFVRSGEFAAKIDRAFDLDALGMYTFRRMHGTGSTAQGVYVNSNFTRPGLTTDGLASYELEAQKLAYHVGGFLTRRMPGFEKAGVTAIGTGVGYRASRKISGRARMRKSWMACPQPVRHDDVIGLVLASLPTSHAEIKETGPFRADHATDVPFGVMVPEGVRNILCGSGKSACQDEFILRSMPKCMMIGQAAGVAAALASRKNASASALDPLETQRELVRQGVILGDSERLRQLRL